MRLFRVILQAIRDRRLPMFAWAGDRIRSTCPRCRAVVTLSTIATGKRAFKCPACGEEGTWKDDA
jgi:hypothetical protein